MSLTHAWCFSVRHSMLGSIRAMACACAAGTATLLTTGSPEIAARALAAREENASVTFTSNRVEWNGQENILITGGDGYQLTGNFLDRAGTCGIALRGDRGRCSQMTITGNFLKRSGKRAAPE